MIDHHPAPARPADPVATASAALALLDTGRVDMARRLLEDPPEAIRVALAAAKPPVLSPTALQLAEAELARVRAHIRALSAETSRLRAEHRQGEADVASHRREMARLDAELAKRRRALERGPRPPAAPPAPKPHQVLAQALADGRVTVERVAEVLCIRPGDVAPIAAGRVGLGESAWKRVLWEVGG